MNGHSNTMNVRLTNERGPDPDNEQVLADEDCQRVICAIDPASSPEVEVRRIKGKLAIIVTGGRVTMHPRATAVWIEVES